MKRRNTPTQQAILDLFQQCNRALNPEMIEDQLVGQMDRATIYRILNRFHHDGLLHRIAADNGKYYFALCNACQNKRHHHDHFHFRCEKCEQLICLSQDVRPNLPDGFEMTGSNCIIIGICAPCKNKN